MGEYKNLGEDYPTKWFDCSIICGKTTIYTSVSSFNDCYMFLYKLYEPPHRGNHVCVAQQTRTFFGTFLLPLLVVTH